MTPTSPLPDGRYDAFVVDAERTDAGVHVEVTIVTGEHKGEMVDIGAPTTIGDPLELIGMPATLTVGDGLPHLTIDG